MGKKKTKKPTAAPRSAKVVVTWAQVFNANDTVLADITDVADRARSSNYEYFARLGRLWAVVVENHEVKWRDLTVTTDHLVTGIEVTIHPTDGPVSAEPVKKRVWIVTRADYDYNDENYDLNEGVHPVVAFSSKVAAEDESKKRNIDSAVTYDDSLWEFLDDSYDSKYGKDYDHLVDMPWYAWRDWLMERGCPEDQLPGVGPDGDPTSKTLNDWWSTSDWVKGNSRTAIDRFHLPFYDVCELDHN